MAFYRHGLPHCAGPLRFAVRAGVPDSVLDVLVGCFIKLFSGTPLLVAVVSILFTACRKSWAFWNIEASPATIMGLNTAFLGLYWPKHPVPHITGRGPQPVGSRGNAVLE